MWVTIEVDPDDPRLDTSGSKAKRSRELVDDMHDRPPTYQYLYDIDVKCHSFDGCEVIEYDDEALYSHFEKLLTEGEND